MKKILLPILLVSALLSQAQYTDLPANITWNQTSVAAGTTTVENVESAYNNARTNENTALGTNIPLINFPTATVWDNMSPNAKAFWIINQERTARGLAPLEDTATEVITVTQNYNDYLIEHDTTGHIADGHNPMYRLQQDATINACMQAYNENIAYIYSGYSVPPTNGVERMIYWLIYEDASSNWGHRRNFFKSDFNDDSGVSGKEGVLGIGFTIATGYKTWNYVAFSTYNIIDPCSSWVFPEIPTSDLEVELTIESITILNPVGVLIKVCSAEGIDNCYKGLSPGLYIITTAYTNGYKKIEKVAVE